MVASLQGKGWSQTHGPSVVRSATAWACAPPVAHSGRLDDVLSGDEEHDQLERGPCVQRQLLDECSVLGVVGQGEAVSGTGLGEASHKLAESADEVVRLLRLRGDFCARSRELRVFWSAEFAMTESGGSWG